MVAPTVRESRSCDFQNHDKKSPPGHENRNYFPNHIKHGHLWRDFQKIAESPDNPNTPQEKTPTALNYYQ